MKMFRLCLLITALGAVWSASIPFQYQCSKENGFVMDPNEHNRVGYITDFTGLGVTLQRDLNLSLPFKPIYPQMAPIPGINGGPMSARVVGVIEKLTWDGGVSAPISIEFYVSQQSAFQLKAILQTGLKTTSVQSIGWLIGDYDQETKGWFEQAKPVSPLIVKAMIQGSSAQPLLSIDLTPIVVKNGIDVYVYKASINIVPQAHQGSTLLFANSSKMSVNKLWGLP